jgi:hypothetical protein
MYSAELRHDETSSLWLSVCISALREILNQVSAWPCILGTDIDWRGKELSYRCSCFRMWPGVVYETLLMQAPAFMQAGTLETPAIAGIIIGKTFARLLRSLKVYQAATQETNLVHWFSQT